MGATCRITVRVEIGGGVRCAHLGTIAVGYDRAAADAGRDLVGSIDGIGPGAAQLNQSGPAGDIVDFNVVDMQGRTENSRIYDVRGEVPVHVEVFPDIEQPAFA